MKMTAWTVLLVFSLFFSLLACATSDESDGGDKVDDDTGAGDDDSVGEGWMGVIVEEISAPTQYSVAVVLNQNVGESYATDPQYYSFASSNGDLTIEEIAYDANTNTVTFTTSKQALGVTYTLTINRQTVGVDDIVVDFLAADTALFYAEDFETGLQYQLTAYRAGVGETCVLYVEEGQTMSDVEETVDAFDNQIYPIETATFTEPTDIDQNGRIVLLGLYGGEWYGGYFSAVNQFSDAETMDWWDLHSNEAEMIYINTIDETFYPVIIVPHEFAHLLYHVQHGLNEEYWAYHDEGLAECAVHAVFGANEYAVNYYLADINGIIAGGLSMVDWVYAQYENYVLAYLWWTYLASRLNGAGTYSDIFAFPTGNPTEANTFTETYLASDFNTVHFESLLASWVQAPTGPYGFAAMMSFPAASCPTVASGTSSLDLEPFGGAFFALAQSQVSYPGTQGANIVYAGIDADGNVDLDEPFDIAGGALVVYNRNFEYTSFPAEHSGPDIAAPKLTRGKHGAPISPAWNDPPPFNPERPDLIRAWRDARIIQMVDERLR